MPISLAANPLPFVGRETELAQLRTAFAAATAGQGRLLLVTGEPGIGKTTLCQRLAASVTAEAGCALVGRCDDAGALSVPYLPFIEAMRAAVSTHGLTVLADNLGEEAPDLARLIPELRAGLPSPKAPLVAWDPVEARYRLLRAATAFLQTVASKAPTLLVLEDLQDADYGTLDLLAYLGSHLAETQLLVIGTYRDAEVDARHALAHTLATIRRSVPIDRIRLDGLPLEAVRALVDGIAERSLPGALAQAVHQVARLRCSAWTVGTGRRGSLVTAGARMSAGDRSVPPPPRHPMERQWRPGRLTG